MKRAMALCAAVAVVAGLLACGGVSPMGGGGDSKTPPMDANSPYMYGKDFSACESGKWVAYKQTPGDMETSLKCVGKDGDSHLIQVGMKMAGMEYDHLLTVAADAKVSKAWFSGKGYDKWESVKVNETPTGAGGGEAPKECAMCKKPFADHKQPEITEGDESVKVGDKDVACKKIAVKMYNCEGADAGTTTYWFSADVPALHQMYSGMLKLWGKEAAGGLVKYQMASMSLELVGFGSDAKSKHELPK